MAAGEGMRGGGARGREALGWAELRVVGAPGVLLGPFYRRPRRWRAGRIGGGPAGFVAGFNGGGGELLCCSASRSGGAGGEVGTG